MILTNNELRSHIYGAVYFGENEGIIPYRFDMTKISNIKDDELRLFRHQTGAGIKIDFSTDTEELGFKFRLHTSCEDSQIYKHYFFDVYVDNKLILHQGDRNTKIGTTGEIYISLKKGVKRITIYLPCSALIEIFDFTISDGALVNKHEYDKNILFLGDSITHSAYIDFPSLSYSNILSRKKNYNILNQAIGGDIFMKENLDCVPEFKPDIVFVAYGTNDWACNDPSALERIEEYFDLIKKIYDNVEINVILPLWRRDINEHPDFVFSFSTVRETIKKSAMKHGLKVVDGFDFVPEHELLWWDGYLHPNESGFLFYADALEKYLESDE